MFKQETLDEKGKCTSWEKKKVNIRRRWKEPSSFSSHVLFTYYVQNKVKTGVKNERKNNIYIWSRNLVIGPS